MTKPAISVLIPGWNAAATIRGAIASVLSYREASLECLVIDDGSTDATADVVVELAAADPRVHLIRLAANAGVSAARNRGLEVASGEWLTFLDADDRFTPGGLAALHRAAATRDADVVVGQQVWSDGRSHWIGPLYDIPDIRRPGRKSIASAPGLLYYVSPHGKLFRRSMVGDLRFEGRVLGDQPWMIRALLRAGDRIEVLAETVYEWIRVPPRGSGPSITATTRGSAGRGIEATNVARGALVAVLAEADRTLADSDDRAVVGRAYAERLLRSDLGVHLARALGRADPKTGALIDALASFVAAVPPDLLRDGDPLARDVVLPAFRAWYRLEPEARIAVRRLSEAALAVQPDLAEHAGTRIERWAFRRALRRPSPGSIVALQLSNAVRQLRDVPRGAAAVRRRVRRALPG